MTEKETIIEEVEELEEDRRFYDLRREHITMYFRLLAAIAAVNTAMLVRADTTASNVFHLACFLSLMSVFGSIMNNQGLVSIIHEIHVEDDEEDEAFGDELTNDESRTTQHLTLKILLAVGLLCIGVLTPDIHGSLCSVEWDYILVAALTVVFAITCLGFFRGDQMFEKWQKQLLTLYKTKSDHH